MLDKLSISCEFGEGWVTAEEIDKLGLAGALRTGITRALAALDVQIKEEIIMDGKVNYVPTKFVNVKCLVDADNLVPIVSAASIYAKVKRDKYMTKLKKQYPGYGFENHVGYGTAVHKQAITRFGVLSGVHRMSFKPLQGFSEAVR